MNLNSRDKSINCSIALMGILCAFTGAKASAGTMGPVSEPGGLYVSVFGGAGASTKTTISQYGTAFFTEAEGGPLAVNAFGRTNSRTVGLVGANLGYKISPLLINAPFSVTPAVELEGYYMGSSSLVAQDLVNETARLDAHDFIGTYPMKSGVFLTNAVVNFNPASYTRFHPYVGVGIGAAVTSISNATSIQTSPVEAINHYNSNPSNTQAMFAAQTKAGLNFDFTQNTSLFLEYRWLYMASSDYTFGSTVGATHPVTSSWLVRIDPQNYNLGAVGIRYTV